MKERRSESRMMTPGRIVAVMLTACVALILSHPATLAQAPDRHAVHRFANLVDVTHALDEYTPDIPVPGITFPFKKTPIATVAKNNVAANRWEIREHLGTQVDAPIHFFEGGAPDGGLVSRRRLIS